MTESASATNRFTDRVRDYVRYRPSYPAATWDAIEAATKLARGALVCDVGSGTGISSRLWLDRGYRVTAIEPNAAMRAEAEATLRDCPGFRSVAGTAEATTLEDGSVDLVFAAQAFHWFERDAAKVELTRIAKSPGWAAIVWNERLVDTPLLAAYEKALFEHAIDYAKVDHRNVDAEKVKSFFLHAPEKLVAPNEQRFDRDGFFGRALSSSYVPQRGHPKHEAMMDALTHVWETYADHGAAIFRYQTIAWVGRLK